MIQPSAGKCKRDTCVILNIRIDPDERSLNYIENRCLFRNCCEKRYER